MTRRSGEFIGWRFLVVACLVFGAWSVGTAAPVESVSEIPLSLPGAATSEAMDAADAVQPGVSEPVALDGIDAPHYDDEFHGWQVINFGSTNAAGGGAEEDFDGDGFNNWSEFCAGTDPTNSLEFLELLSACTNDSFMLSWPSRPGRSYDILASDSLTQDNFFVLNSNIVATIPENTVEIDPAVDVSTRYYRIAVSGYDSVYSPGGILPPTDVVATDNTYTDKVVVAWAAVSNATEYYVYRYLDDAQPAIGKTMGLSYEDRSGTAARTYYYRVKAYHPASGLSDFSSPYAEGYRAKYLSPYVPTGVMASAAAYTDKIALSWDPVDDAELYCIYRNSTQPYHTFYLVGETDQTSYEDFISAHSNDLSYNYLVLSYNEARGLSDKYDTMKDYRVGYLKPAKPTNFKVWADGNYLRMSCDEVDGHYYYFYRSTSPEGPFEQVAWGSGNTSYQTRWQITPGVRYYYKVKVGENWSRYSDFSDVESGYLDLNVSSWSVSASDGDYEDFVRVSWDENPGAEGYYIYRGLSRTGELTKVGYSTELSFDDTTADENTVYEYKVNPFCELTGEIPNPYFTSGYRKLKAPTNMEAGDGAHDDGIMLTWDPVKNATTYTLYYSLSPTGNWSWLQDRSGSSETWYKTTIPARGLRFYFRCVAFVDDIGWTPYSESEGGFWRMLKPGALSVSQGSYEDRLRFSWSASSNAETFFVYRSTSLSGPFAEIATTTDSYYDDTTAEYGRRYSYKVSAYNLDTGHSETSNYSSYGYRGANPPAAPISVLATDGTYTNSVRISWSAPSYADQYHVYRSTSPAGSYSKLFNSEVSTTSYEDTTADAEVDYYYKVRAQTYACGYSDLSDYDAGYAQGAGGLTAPSGVEASDGGFNNYVRIWWDEVVDADRYDVYRCATPNGSHSQIDSVSCSYCYSYDDTNAVLGVTNYYKVRAYSAASGTSGFSSSDAGYRGLKAPSNVSATDGDFYQKVRIEWSFVSQTETYSVYRSTTASGPYSKIGESTSTSYEDTPPQRNVTYYYKVQGYDEGGLGYSAMSASDSGYAEGSSSAPDAPGGIYVSVGAYTDHIRVNWDIVDAADCYHVYRSSSENGVYSEITVLSNSYKRSYDDYGATPGTTYYYKLKSFSVDGGYSGYSSSGSGYAGLGASGYITASDGTEDDSVKLYWYSVAHAERYDLYRSESASGTYAEIAQLTDNRYVDTNAVAGVVYYYKVRSYDPTYGYSAFSDYDSGYYNLQKPSSVSVSRGTYEDKVRISWQAVDHAERYYVKRSTTSSGSGTALGNTTQTFYDDHAVSQGVTYFYSVRSYSSDAGYSDWSPYRGGYTDVSAPAGLTASDGISTNYVTISWSAVSTATRYYVHRSTSAAGAYSEVATTTSLSINDTSASAGQTYYYKVKAYTPRGFTDFGNYDAGYREAPAMPPAAPKSVSASDGSYDDYVRISWSASSGATRYHVYRRIYSGSTYSEIGNTTSTSYNDTTAVAGESYYYKVKAYNSNGYSDYSSYNSGYRSDPGTPPGAPTGVEASDRTYSDFVQITWNAVSDAGVYYIHRSTSMSGNYVQLGSTSGLSYSDTSASPGVTYYYAVKANNIYGSSSLSTFDAGTRSTNVVSSPGIPTGVSASDQSYSDRIRVSWNAVPGAERYYVYRSSSANGSYSQVASSTSTSYDDYSVDAGTYYYKVRSYKSAGGYSDYSSYDSGQKSTSATLASPTGISASDGSYTNKIRVSWNSVSGAEQYYVYRSSSAFGSYVSRGTTTATYYEDTAVAAGSSYYYKLRAYSAANGYSDYSASDGGFVKSTSGTTPDTPSGITATDGTYADRVRVSWNLVSGAERYYIYRSSSSGGMYYEQDYTTALNYDDSTAIPGSTYYYKIRAYNSGRYSGYSNYDQGHRKKEETNVPAVPTGVAASDGTYTDRVRISWNAVAGADEYNVFRKSNANASRLLVGRVAGLSFEDISAVEGNNYHYGVRAYNKASGQYSEISSYDPGYARTAAELIASPSGVTATKGTYTDRVRITWNAVPGAAGYAVCRVSPNHHYLYYYHIGNASSTSFDDTTATPGTTYRYKVKTYNAAGQYSYFSDHGEGMIAISAVSGISASDGTSSDEISITWNAVPGASKYLVHRSTSPDSGYTLFTTAFISYANDRLATPGVTYYYKIQTYSSSTKEYSPLSSEYDSGFISDTVTAPARPTGVDASDGQYSDRVQISWDSVSGAERYNIYRGTSWREPGISIGNTTATTFNDTSATPGENYYYRVRSYSAAGGYSDLSDYNIGYRPTVTPSAPSGVTAGDGTYTDRVRISWNAVSGADRYYVYRSTSSYGTFSQIGSTTSTSYDDTGANAGATYYYKVKSYVTSGGAYSDFSSSDSGYKRVDVTPPAAPTGVSATDGAHTDRVRVTWNSVSGAERYYVYRSASQSGTYSELDDTTSTTYDDRNATAGVTYYYKVRAYSSAGGYSTSYGDSDYGYRGTAAVAPAAPAGVSASDGESYSYVRVSWNSVFGADKYYVYRSTSLYGTYEEIASRTSASYGYYDYAVGIGTTYYYKVKSYDNDGGYSSFSSGDGGYAVLPAPDELRGSVSSGDRIDLYWDPIGVVGVSISYEIHRSTSASGPFSKIATVTGQHYYFDSSVSASTTYYYKLRAYTVSYGHSDYVQANFTTTYGAPSNLQVLSQNPVRLSWNAVSPTPTRYHVYRSKNGGPLEDIGTTTGTTYTDSTSQPASEYQYRVSAYHSSYGYSDSSECVTYVTTSGGNVYNLTASGAYISWHIPESYNYCQSVHLYRSTSPGGPYTEIHSEDAYDPSGISAHVDGTMANATVYYYKMRAYYNNDWGYTDYTDYISTYKMNRPSLSSISYGTYNDRVCVVLSGTPEASEYIIYRRDASVGGYDEASYTEIGRTSSGTYDDYTAQPGVLYLYGAKAVYSGMGTSRMETSSYYGLRN